MLAHMIARVSFPQIFDYGTIVRVAFQQRLAGWMLDDVVVHVRTGDGIIERIALQITLDLTMTGSDPKFRAIIGAAYHAYLNKEPAYYGFVTRADTTALNRLTLSAFSRGSDPEQWVRDVNTPLNFDKSVRDTFGHLKSALTGAMRREPTAADMVSFLDRFKPITIRVGQEGDPDSGPSKLFLRQQFGLTQEECDAAYNALRDAAESGARNRHAYTDDLLRKWVERRRGRWFSRGLDVEPIPGRSAASFVAAVVLEETQVRRSTTERVLIQHVESQELELREVILEDVVDAEAALRRGDIERAVNLAAGARRPTRLATLSADERSRLAVLEGRLAIVTRGDLDKARQALREAESYATSPSTRKFAAQIEIEANELDKAVAILPALDPTTSATLSAIIALMRGRADDALNALKLSPEDETIETHRLRALAYLMLSDRDAALAEARLGHKMEPSNDAIRHTLAVTVFNVGLVPGIPVVAGSAPQAIPPAYARTDAQGIAALREAAELFATISREGRRATDRIALDVWQLGAVVLQRTGPEQAADLVARILDVDPAQPDALAWASLYNLPFDVARSRESLGTLTQGSDGSLDHVRALTMVSLDSGDKHSAAEVLRRYREAFISSGLEDQYQALWAEATFGESRPGDSDAPPDEPGSDDPDDNGGGSIRPSTDRPDDGGGSSANLRRVTAFFEAEKTGDWSDIIAMSSERFTRSQSVIDLLSYATVLHNGRRWSELADLAPRLFAVQNADATTYALQGLYNADRLTDFLDAYDRFRTAYCANLEPPQLRRARAIALERVGRLLDSIAAWESVLETDGEPSDALVALMRVHAALGDVGELRRIGELLLSSTVSPDIVIGAASLAQPLARDVAVRLWRRAAADVSDAAVSETLSLGYRLSMDAEPVMEALTHRMVALAGTEGSGIQQISLDELPTRVRHWSEAADASFLEYRRGDVPVHVLAGRFGATLADIWQSVFSGRGELYTRFGARVDSVSLPSIEAASARRFGLDLTTILTLQHVGLLERVLNDERVFYSVDVLGVVHEMHDAVTSSQPDVTARDLRLYNRIESGELKSTDLPRPDALTVVATDPQNSDQVALLVVAMRQTGVISDDPSALVRRMGLRMPQDMPVSSTLPSSVHLDATAAVLLESVDLLQPLSYSVSVSVTSETEHLMKRSIDTEHERRRRADWLSTLRDLLASRVKMTLPSAADVATDVGSAVRPLLALLQHMQGSNDVIVVDDRYSTQWPTTDRGAALITAIELIVELFGCDSQEYQKAISQLRNANVFFLPLTPDEVVSALRDAALDENAVLVESPRLRDIRKYVAGVVQRSEFLRRPSDPNSGAALGELPYLLLLSRLSTESLTNIWSDREISHARKVAASDWILDELYIDDLPHVHIARLMGPTRSDAAVISIGIAVLLYRAMSMMADRETGPPFLDFLVSRLIHSRALADPEIADELALRLADLFRFVVDLGKSEQADERVALLLAHELMIGLPEAIQHRLASDEALRGILPVTLTQVVDFEGIRFESDPFWASISATQVDHQSRRIWSMTPRRRWSIEFIDNDVHIRSDDADLAVRDDALAYASQGPEDRIAFLRNIGAEWFDIPSGEREPLYERLSGAPTVGEFMQGVNDARSANIERQAFAIAAHIRRYGKMPVGAASHTWPRAPVTFLRLQEKRFDVAGFAEAAHELIVDVGLEEAILRFFLLPVALPKPLLDAWAALEPRARRASYNRVAARAKTSLDHFHLRVLLGTSDFAGRRARLRELDAVLADYSSGIAVAAHLATVEWANRSIVLHLAERGEANNRFERIAASWIAGSVLYRALRSLQIPDRAIREGFSHAVSLAATLFQPRSTDQSEPRDIRTVNFIAKAFAYGYSNASRATGRIAQSWTKFFTAKVQRQILLPRVGIMPFGSGDSIDSFLGDDIRRTLRAVLPDAAMSYEDENRRQLMMFSVERLTEAPSDPLPWSFIAMLQDLVGEEEVASLRSAATQLDFAAMLEGEESRTALLLLLKTPRLLDDPSFAHKMRERVVGAALAQQAVTRESVNRQDDQVRAATLHEAASAIAQAHAGELREKAEVYVAIARQIGLHWPKSHRLLLRHFVHFARHLPVSEGVPFGQLILDARRS